MMNDDEQEILEAVIIKRQKSTDLLATVRYLVSVAIYCLIGLAIYQWLFVADGASIQWGDFRTYMVMIFWPWILFWKLLVALLWVFLIAFVIGFFAICAYAISHW